MLARHELRKLQLQLPRLPPIYLAPTRHNELEWKHWSRALKVEIRFAFVNSGKFVSCRLTCSVWSLSVRSDEVTIGVSTEATTTVVVWGKREQSDDAGWSTGDSWFVVNGEENSWLVVKMVEVIRLGETDWADSATFQLGGRRWAMLRTLTISESILDE